MKRRKSNFEYRSVQQTTGVPRNEILANNTAYPGLVSGNGLGTKNLILSAAKSDCSSLVMDDDLLTSAAIMSPMNSNNMSSALHRHQQDDADDDDDNDDNDDDNDMTSRQQRHHNLAHLNPKQQQYNNYVTYAFVFHQTLVDLMRIMYCLFYANNMYFEYKRYLILFLLFFLKISWNIHSKSLII